NGEYARSVSRSAVACCWKGSFSSLLHISPPRPAKTIHRSGGCWSGSGEFCCYRLVFWLSWKDTNPGGGEPSAFSHVPAGHWLGHCRRRTVGTRRGAAQERGLGELGLRCLGFDDWNIWPRGHWDNNGFTGHIRLEYLGNLF